MVNKMRIPRYINKIINRLQSNGYEAYIVGGAVRDYVLGKTPNDYDISTSALPKQIVALFKDYKIVTNGIKHGTVCVICENKFVEITTYRKDENYIDHRHPSSITFVDDLKIDLSRRDFTINALAYNTEVIDYFDGINDVKNGIIRAVGDANIRFEEDALRILRALRFSSIKGFTIEENTSRAMKEKKDLISFISKERIYNELSKIILGKNFNYVIINHVMEHVEEQQAISELKRVLTTDGKLIMSFPVCIDNETTIEDSAIVTDEDRIREYGQKDHIRLYGMDYKDRMEKYGLDVDIYSPKDFFSDQEIEYYGFIENDIMLICRKANG